MALSFTGGLTLILQIICALLSLILILRIFSKKKKKLEVLQLYLSLFFMMHLISVGIGISISLLEIIEYKADILLLSFIYFMVFFTLDMTYIFGYIFASIMLKSSKSFFSKRKNILLLSLVTLILIILNASQFINYFIGAIYIIMEISLGIIIIIRLNGVHKLLDDHLLKKKCKFLIIGFLFTQIISGILFIFYLDFEVTDITTDPIVILMLSAYYILLMTGLILIESSFRLQ